MLMPFICNACAAEVEDVEGEWTPEGVEAARLKAQAIHDAEVEDCIREWGDGVMEPIYEFSEE